MMINHYYLFHRECLEKYEFDKWNQDPYSSYNYPDCLCPYCKNAYNAEYEKFA